MAQRLIFSPLTPANAAQTYWRSLILDLSPVVFCGMGKRVRAMYFPQFLVGLLTTSVVVGAWAYVATGSVWKSVAWAFIAAALLQAGYFMLVLKLVYRQQDTEQEAQPTTPEASKEPVVPNRPLHRDGR
jgi:hypothetical protein